MIKQTWKILALAALPFLLTPAAQADTRLGVYIGERGGNLHHHRARDADKGHRGYRDHKRRNHHHGRRGHEHRASHFNVSPRAYVTRDHDFGRRYLIIGHRHHHDGPVSGRFCSLW